MWSGLGGGGGGGVRVDLNEELKFCENSKKIFFWGGSCVCVCVGGGGSGRQGVGNGVGVRVDVNEELKFLGKFQKKKNFFLGGGGGSGQVGVGLVGGGVRVDMNE